MKRRLEVSEALFRAVAYFLLIAFAAMCVYPFVYAVSAAVSTRNFLDAGKVILLPKGFQLQAFAWIFTDNSFWLSYANTLFMATVGTVWSMVYTVLGAYALSKKRLMGRKGFNFFLVFTLWFSAGVTPQFLNYQATGDFLAALAGTVYENIDQKWLIVLAMGMNATNVILLRNAFEGVPAEIEEAARIDGATELQILWQVYLPMCKATLATVALFFAISRWNGYFWAMRMMPSQEYSWPVQVYIRDFIQNNTQLTGVLPEGWTWEGRVAEKGGAYNAELISNMSVLYAMVICAVVPILCIYPFIQKYFAKGVNMGGVKE